MKNKSMILIGALALIAFLLYYFTKKAANTQDIYQETTTHELTGLSSLISSGSGLWATLLTNKANNAVNQANTTQTGTQQQQTNITGNPMDNSTFLENSQRFGQVW